jgi:hypothetical protein
MSQQLLETNEDSLAYERTLHNFAYASQCVVTTAFTAVLPTAYAFISSLGGSATFSGIVIGAFNIGVLAGSLLQRGHGVSPTTTIVKGMCVLFLGLCLYVVPAVIDVPGALGLALVFTARVVQGFGFGYVVPIISLMIISFGDLSPEALQGRMVKLAAINDLSLGLGPIVSACGQWIVARASGSDGIAGPSLAVALLVLLLAVALRYGVPASVKIPHATVSSGECSQGPARWTGPDCTVAVMLFLAAMRAFIVASVESATSLILATEFGLGTVPIGYAVGSVFFLALPASMMNKRLGHFSNIGRMRFGLWTAAIGCLLLFRWPCIAFHLDNEACMCLLLAADCFIFPSMCIVFGLCLGHAAALLPRCQKIDKATFTRLNSIFINIARGLSSPTARLQVSTFGRGSYGVQQLILLALSWIALDCALPKLLQNRTTSVSQP